MKDVIEILRQQIVLGKRLLELLVKQKQELLKANAKEARATSIAQESVMAKIAELEKRQTQLLFKLRAKDLTSWMEEQPETPERNIARQLLEKQRSLLVRLKQANQENRQFLDRNIKFIDYNVNVMTQTTAGVTYGTPEGNGGRPVQGTKMFEANI